MTTTEKAKTKEGFDLGSEKVFKTFLTILIPTLIAQVIAGTFVVFDTFFVSHGFQPGIVGTGISEGISFTADSYSALGPAAISYAMPYTFFIIGVGLMIGAGLAATMTKAKAKNDSVTYQNAMNAFLPMAIFFGVILMIVLLVFSKVFVWFGSGFQKDYISSWFNTPLLNKNWTEDFSGDNGWGEMYNAVNGHILSQAGWYLKIQALGAIPYIYMSGGVIMLRVQGKAQYATSFSAVGLVTNIVLDFIFIIVLRMNVVGAAIATVIGQYATASIYFWFFQYKSETKATSMDWKYSFEKMGETCKGGVSIMMLQVLTGLVLIIFTFSIGLSNWGQMYAVTNYTSVYQGYNAVFIFLNLVIIGIAQSMSPIVGYNAVKGDVEKVKKARMYGMGSSLVFSVASMLFIMIFAKSVIGAFYSVDGSTMDYITSGYFGQEGIIPSGGGIYTNGLPVAQKVLRMLFLTFPVAVMINVSGTYLQSVGEDKKTGVLLFGKVICLVPIILILSVLGLVGVDIITSNWQYLDGPIKATEELPAGVPIPELSDYLVANLNIFLALPIVDVIFGTILVVYLIDTEKNVIKKMTMNA